jgi:hypothetical protein
MLDSTEIRAIIQAINRIASALESLALETKRANNINENKEKTDGK